MNLTPMVFCMLILSLTMILKSWSDCGSDHDEENTLTYPGENKLEVN